jgi:N-acetylmuramoyl-L-alanine amidase
MKLEDDYTTKYEGFDPKSPESYIMFTLMQNAFSEQSLDLAARLQDEFKQRVGRYDRGVKQGGFWVLWTTTMPSILTEVGFISNATEERYLNSKEGQDYLASAIYRACRDYIAEIDRKSDIYSPVTEPVSPKPELAKNIVPVNDKVIFMVQVAASSKRQEITASAFKNLTDVREISDGARFRYATGSFDKYDDAVNYRKQIESVYPDAFVIAVKNNKILPLQEALNR